MFLQGIAIIFLIFVNNFYTLAILSAFLGIGTALVYPTFLSTIAQVTNPNQRAESIGTFRLWRDLGYAFGAIISGITADIFGLQYAILLIGIITIFSAIIIQIRMDGKL
jgi:MFS family permease